MVLQRISPGNWAYCVEKAGKKLATANALMKDRIQNQRAHYERGAWASENFNCIKGRILGARAKFNPLISYAKQAVEAQITGEFYLTDEITYENGIHYNLLLEQIAEQDAKKPIERKRVIDLGEAKTHNVPTDAFADDVTISWLAGGKKPADKYGLFLRNDLPENLRLQEVTVYHMPLSEKDYARGAWLCRLDRCGRSGFVCYGGSLSYDGGSVFRVVDS